MSQASSYPSAKGTEGLDPVQYFDCENEPIPPGMKAQDLGGPRPSRSVAWGWWVVTAALAAVAGVAGWLLGRG
jgi:hypothetical protein